MAGLLPDKMNVAPTAQTGGLAGNARKESPAPDWLSRAQRAFSASTTYVDANYRKQWEDSIRAFNNQHPSDSKYNAPSYDKRSKLFRPKTRTIMRKNEAAAAAAFFSSMDVTSVLPIDPNNQAEIASAAIMKELLQYRLTRTIPWYLFVLGGLQDAQTTGVVCGHIYWNYQERSPEMTALNAVETVKQETKPEESEEYPAQSELPEGAVQATSENELA